MRAGSSSSTTKAERGGSTLTQQLARNSFPEGLGARLAANQGPVYLFLYNKWFFDELYQATFVRGAKLLGDLFWKGGDQKLIDGLGPDGVSAVSYQIGKGAGRLQTGFLYHYAFVMLLGVAAILSYALWAWNA